MSQMPSRPPSARRARPTGRKPDFMTYPYPETERIMSHLETLAGLKEESKRCIANLLQYRAVRTRARLPRGQSAAVLVPLFVGRSGDLYVLLSRRSDGLKTFSGDTALPGGKNDAQDVTVEDTARREAFEEIGLPQDKERVPLLCVMEPHLAKGEMLVTPVVVLILDNSLQPNLNSSEVTSIFAQPLVSFLSSMPHFSSSRAADPGIPYHTFEDLPWADGGTVRLHRFLTGREAEGVKPVFGLTAAILIRTATVGYGRPPDFEVQSPDAPTATQRIAHALLTPANPLRVACEQEGVDVNKTAARLLRPPLAANATRTIEWGKIATKWKDLLGGDNPASVRDHVDNEHAEGAEGLGAKIEAHKEAREHKERTEENGKGRVERGEERKAATPGMARLEEFLDETRDMVDERMKELKNDEKKLAEARNGYQKIMAKVKKQVEVARSDSKALSAMIPREGQEGLEHGIKAGIDGVKKGRGNVGNEGRDEGIERGKEGTRRGSEEMNKYVGKGGNCHNPEQASHRKRDAKL